ncbi:VRR-NUC domain-containing protein [Paraburkholderia hayleyella]|uniref:VRR-NUC domain-containing protein n=1 Tax=Paraburkholderia hayleyella TaxID=2152889 RepID=UPI0015802D85|nr:VRR-NUC domain-containing protein [Paraburkholderia hayleyella]
MTPYDSTVTIKEDTQKYVRLPDGGMGYLEEKIRSALWWPDIGLRVRKSDGLVGVSLLKQIAMSAAIRWDEKDRDYYFRYKAEVSFDMRPFIFADEPPMPFLSTSNGTDEVGRRHTLNPFPLKGAAKGTIKGYVRRPDVIIVTDEGNRWPGRGSVDHDGRKQTPNLQRLVEVKFPRDDWGENQERDYLTVAGGNSHMTVLNVEGGDQRSKELVKAAVTAAFLGWLAGRTRVRARIRSRKPVQQPAWFEAWSALEAGVDSAGNQVAALWDTTRQGVRQLSDETQAWLHESAGWLFEKGRWVADMSGQTWHYVDEKSHTLWRYTTMELVQGWQQIRRQTDLTAAQLKQIDWGHVLITAVKGVATVVLLIAGVVVVVVLAQTLIAILAALVAIATTAGGTVLIAALA